MSKIKALIFDLDGTCADTIGAITEASNMARQEFGYGEITKDDVRRVISYGTLEFARGILDEKDKQDDQLAEKMRLKFAEKYRQTYLHTDRCFDGLTEVLEKLAKDYKLGMNSNKADDMVAALTKTIVRPGLFSASCGVVPGRAVKPDPAGAYEICRQLGVEPSEAAYIGDSDIDLETAKNGRFLPILVCWGYKTEAELREAGAVNIAHDPEELYDMIKKLDR